MLHERPALVQAALVVIAWFIESGEPDQGLEPWSGFDGWSLVRGAMLWANLEDPALSNEILRIEVDQVDELLVEVLHDGWLEIENAHRHTPAIAEALELFSLAEGTFDQFRNAAAGLCGKPTGHMPSPREIHKVFTKLRGRVVRGRWLEMVADTPRGPTFAVKGERLP